MRDFQRRDMLESARYGPLVTTNIASYLSATREQFKDADTYLSSKKVGLYTLSSLPEPFILAQNYS